MDEPEATRESYTAAPTHGPPHVIADTADAITGDREKWLESGTNDYLTKPLRSEDLRGALMRIRDSRRNR